MNKILLCSAALALFAGNAMADGIYVAGKVGGSNGEASSIETEPRYSAFTNEVTDRDFTNNVFSWGGAVGYTYDKWLVPLRMEAEYLYRNHYEYNTNFEGLSPSEMSLQSNVDTQTILANFYLDVPVTDMFGVFFGAGLGEAISTTHSKSPGTFGSLGGQEIKGSEDNASFSWMGTAGITVSPLKWLSFDLSYRYSDLGDISWETGNGNFGTVAALETDDFAAQELYLGVRVMVPNMVKKHKHKKVKHHNVYTDK